MNDPLFHRARATPDATALVSAESGTEWSYGVLDGDVERLAGQLASLGLTAGDHLGVLMETSVEFVRLVHAAGRLGLVLVPLNARLTADELAAQADRADLTALVCSADTEPQAVEAADSVPVASVDDPQWEGVTHLQQTAVADFERGQWDEDDTQLLLFTSGTTGQPKAVQLTAGNLQASAVASAFRLGIVPDDRWLVTLPMYHMGGLAPVLRCALYGTTVVVREGFDPGPTADDIGEYDVTGVSLVPTMLTRMLDARGTLSDTLRFVLLGGAPAPATLIERCRDYSVPVYPTYGMTETASQIATADAADAFDFAGTVGRPLMWTEVTVIADDGTPLSPGETGELVVAGPTVTPGYYDDEPATETAFCEHGLRTGDVGRRDESGRLWVLNRKGETIITGGENVQPGEVASVLRDHRDVREVAVVGVPDDEWGERVGALIVPRSESLTVEDVEAHCEASLAGFKRPRLIAFAEELPRTPSGTVKRDAVRDVLLDSVRVDVADAEEAADASRESPAETGEGSAPAESSASAESGSPAEAPESAESGSPAESSASAAGVAPAVTADSAEATEPVDPEDSAARGDEATDDQQGAESGDHEADSFEFGGDTAAAQDPDSGSETDSEGAPVAESEPPIDDVDEVIPDADEARDDVSDSSDADEADIADEETADADDDDTEA
jgi:O-succinylbenzoic acid--CoA ligase